MSTATTKDRTSSKSSNVSMECVNERISLRTFQQQWELLWQREDDSKKFLQRINRHVSHGRSAVPDPFALGIMKIIPSTTRPNADQDDEIGDCADLCIPPTANLLDQVAAEFDVRWGQLEERRIPNESIASRNHPDVQQQRPAWYDRHVRLPRGFDYATRNDQPPSYSRGETLSSDSNYKDDDDDRVMSLDNLTESGHTSYRDELWRLFASVPTVEEVEAQVMNGHRFQRTEAVLREIIDGTKRYPRLDAHALSRLRMNDRHELPPLNPLPPTTATELPQLQLKRRPYSTITLELWRIQPRRGSTPDPHRAVIECLGTQSLKNVHQTIVELTEDHLWLRSKKPKIEQELENVAASSGATEPSSGFFFIEGVFYTIGSVDYVTPIENWLRRGTRAEQRARATYLGIPTVADYWTNLPILKSMETTLLEDIELRLGVRYTHVHHGDVECLVFATDRRSFRSHPREELCYPLLHDIWTPSFTLPDCEVCDYHAATLVTSNTCQATQGHCVLCCACCQELNLSASDVEDYLVWRSQADLSTGAASQTTSLRKFK